MYYIATISLFLILTVCYELNINMLEEWDLQSMRLNYQKRIVLRHRSNQHKGSPMNCTRCYRVLHKNLQLQIPENLFVPANHPIKATEV